MVARLGARHRIRAGRRRAADPARTVRRGRHRPGPARARGCARTSGAGVAASALCMDKDLFKAVLRDRGIPVARNVTLRDGDAARSPLRLPGVREACTARIVRRHLEGAKTTTSSARQSSSLGGTTTRCSSRRAIDGVEVECGVLGNRDPIASVVGEIVAHADWYDYSAKYDEGGMELVDPGAHPRRVGRSESAGSQSTPSSPPNARAWHASTSSCARTARSS